MGSKSDIEWTDATWNPIRARTEIQEPPRHEMKVGWFCSHVSEGCRNCYSETMNRRLGTGVDFKAQNIGLVELFLDEKMLTAPLHWKKPRRIFVCSMTDLFADFVKDEWIDRMFAVMALCPQHTFQILTKRPERMRTYMNEFPERVRASCDGHRFRFLDNPVVAAAVLMAMRPLPNVWLGTSCEDQTAWDERVEHLGATPAAVRFVSVEPLLGQIDCGNAFDDPPEGSPYGKIDWVICGGESGPNARPMHPDWARALRDQCTAAGVPFFFKQHGEWAPCRSDGGPIVFMYPNGTFAKDFNAPGSTEMNRKGKKRAGRLLDGREWNEYPEVHQ